MDEQQSPVALNEESTSNQQEGNTTTQPESVSHELTTEERQGVGSARTWRDGRRLYGQNSQDFLDRACWNWALSGAGDTPNSPAELFGMLSNGVHTRGDQSYQRDFNSTWNWYLPGSPRLQEVYARFRPQVQALWNRRRALGNRPTVAGESRDEYDAQVQRLTSDAVQLAMQMNQLEPAGSEENTGLNLTMGRHPEHGVNWTHWGIEVDDHSFETVPGWGLWHRQNGFAEYEQNGPIEDSQVTRIPLRSLHPGHLAGIRATLNIMGNGSRGSGTQSTRATRSTRSNTRGGGRTGRSNVQGPPPVLIAPPAVAVGTGAMVMHYMPIIAWANAIGTYSNEFHYVRDHQAAAIALLQNGGLTAAAALAFTQQFQAAVNHHAQQNVEYVQPNVQEQIMQTLGVGEQLFAVIRYLRAQQQANQPHESNNTTSTPDEEEGMGQ